MLILKTIFTLWRGVYIVTIFRMGADVEMNLNVNIEPIIRMWTDVNIEPMFRRWTDVDIVVNHL